MLNLKNSLKSKLSSEHISQLLIWQQRLLHSNYLGFRYYCPICKTPLKKFISLRDIADGLFVRDLVIKGKRYSVEQYETLNIDQFLCPVCGAQDKARLYALYFQKMIPRWAQKYNPTHQLRLIHFAPEGGLGEQLRKYPFIRYTSADLERDDVDEKADLTQLPYHTRSVDFFICSHILEHIPNDSIAMKELYRVLKKGGSGILMVPLLVGLKNTYENSKITSQKDRLKHFGQADHVRVYSKKDFLKKLEQVGFSVTEHSGAELGEKNFRKYAITPQSVLYVVHKV